MGRFYGIIFLIFISIPPFATAQTMDCEQTIAYATEEFNAGHFYSVPGILNECLKSFSREQKQRAFLLLTQTYLLLDDPIGAQRSFLEILSANPEFIADEKLHPIDIVYLSKRFTATPKFSWFVGGGTNVSPARVIRSLHSVTKLDYKKYTFLPGYNFGIGGEYSYNDNIKLRLEVSYLNTAYKSEMRYFQKDIQTFKDRQSWLNLPVYVSYMDNIGKYRPYVYAGYSISKLFGDRASIALEKVKTENVNDQEVETSFTVESPDFDFKVRRIPLNQAIIFGGGIKYKIGLDFVFAELRYCAGLKNIVDPDHSFGNYSFDQKSEEWIVSSTPGSAYAHRDDYLRLDNLSISFGFLRPLYKPRELKRARTKSVLRKMKRTK